MTFSQRNTQLLWLAALVAAGGALLAGVFFSLPLELPLLGLAGGALLLYLAGRFPEWFLVAALFASQWKDVWFFQRFNGVFDLTLVMLLFLAGGLVWRILIEFLRSGSKQFRLLFFGQSNQIVAYLLFAGIVSGSYFYTDAPGYGGSKLIRFLFIGGFLLFSPFFLILTEADFRRFARIFLGFAGVTAIQLVGNLELHGQDVSTDITKIGSGWLMGMAIILMVFYPVVQSRKAQRALFVVLLPLLIGGLMASAARGPILAMFAALVIGSITWMREGRLKARTVLILLSIFVAGIGAAFFVLRQADAGKFDAKATEFKSIFSRGSASGSAGDRLNFYQSTLEAIPDHLYFGMGVGSWGRFYYGSDTRGYPHDSILEILFEEGLVGLLAYLGLLLLVGVASVRMLRATRSHFIALPLLVLFSVLVSLTSGDLDDNRVQWLWIGVTLTVCRMVCLQFKARRVARRDFRRRPAERTPFRAIPAYSPQFENVRGTMTKRGRPWREKFVY